MQSMEAFAAFDAFLLIIWILLLIPRRIRRALLLSSIASIPLVVFATLIQPEYYDPPAFTSAPVDLERLIFLFLAGGIATTVYAALTQQRFVKINNGRPMWPERIFVPLGILVAILVPPYLFGWSQIHALVFGEALGLLLVIWIGRDLRNTMLGSAFFVALGYWLLLAGWIALFPDVIHVWDAEAFWGRHLLGVPLGEIILAALFGALWGPLISLISHRHVTREKE